MIISAQYLQLRKANNLIAFKCLPDRVEMIALAALSSEHDITEDILQTGEIEEHKKPFFTIKKDFLPYVGVREQVIDSLLQDGFLPIEAYQFERISQLWQSYQR